MARTPLLIAAALAALATAPSALASTSFHFPGNIVDTHVVASNVKTGDGVALTEQVVAAAAVNTVIKREANNIASAWTLHQTLYLPGPQRWTFRYVTHGRFGQPSKEFDAVTATSGSQRITFDSRYTYEGYGS